MSSPGRLGEQLVLADHAIELGRRHHCVEYVCWGRRWRMDAYAMLGDRLDLAAELAVLAPAVERLGHPAWRTYVLQVRASSQLLGGRFTEALELTRQASAIGGADSEAEFVDLILRSTIARMAGEDADEIVEEVRRAVDDLPYLARGWLATQLVAAGRLEEAEWEWRAIAPHLDRMPAHAAEVLIAGVGYAELCALFGDAAAAELLYPQLSPYAGLQAIGLSCGPYEGPVSLALGRLAVVLGRPDEARAHLAAARRSCIEQRALPHLAIAHAVSATAYPSESREARDHRTRAADLAGRLGLDPRSFLIGAAPPGPVLTARELEVSALVADGLSNAAIADALVVSERTVENHVSHVLRKLGVTSRAAIASWYARRG